MAPNSPYYSHWDNLLVLAEKHPPTYTHTPPKDWFHIVSRPQELECCCLYQDKWEWNSSCLAAFSLSTCDLKQCIVCPTCPSLLIKWKNRDISNSLYTQRTMGEWQSHSRCCWSFPVLESSWVCIVTYFMSKDWVLIPGSDSLCLWITMQSLTCSAFVFLAHSRLRAQASLSILKGLGLSNPVWRCSC